MMQNNYAFIDSENLYKGVSVDIFNSKNKKIYKGWKLDYKKFRIYLNDVLKVKKAFLFIGYVPTNQSLYTKLQNYGYILVFKPTLTNKKGERKGNVDAELVLHTMIEINNYDKAVIVTGDGDFHCLIEYLDKVKKLEKLIIPNNVKFSSLLRDYLKYSLFVSSIRKKVE